MGLNFYKTGGDPIRRGRNFTNPEGSDFCQSGGVPILSIRGGPNFANLEGSDFFQPEGLIFCQNLRRQQKRK